MTLPPYDGIKPGSVDAEGPGTCQRAGQGRAGQGRSPPKHVISSMNVNSTTLRARERCHFSWTPVNRTAASPPPAHCKEQSRRCSVAMPTPKGPGRQTAGAPARHNNAPGLPTFQ
ncbi:hypothetical protein AGIG_G24201 [Arapaima gigas]